MSSGPVASPKSTFWSGKWVFQIKTWGVGWGGGGGGGGVISTLSVALIHLCKFMQFTEFLKKLDACVWTQSNMASYLVALTAEGGIPLFTRTKGDLQQVNGATFQNHTFEYVCIVTSYICIS